MDNEEIMKNAREDEHYYNTLDQAVVALENYKKKGENVFINFNNHKLYSLIDDIDSCYEQVTGYDYETYQTNRREFLTRQREESIREELEALDKIPGWEKRGHAIIYPQQQKDWDECVRVRAGDLYHGTDLENALRVMESLSKYGDMEKAYKIYDAPWHSGASSAMVKGIVLSFSENGTKFYRYACKKEGIEITPEDEQRLKEIDDKFAKYRAEDSNEKE